MGEDEFVRVKPRRMWTYSDTSFCGRTIIDSFYPQIIRLAREGTFHLFVQYKAAYILYIVFRGIGLGPENSSKVTKYFNVTSAQITHRNNIFELG